MSGPSDLTLWNRIQTYELDNADVSRPFIARLASENGWSTAYAQKVCLEYKRFIYLVCISPQTITPSEAVDKV